MGGVSDILRDPHLDPSERQGLLDDLDDATSRAKLMTSQLLSFGRTPVTDLKPVDLSAVVHALSRMLPRLLGSTIQVEVHTAPGAWVRASHAGLEQVLLNLAVNARDAMPRGGRLEIRVTVEEQAVVLTARDTGVGMDAATQERIFEPFFSTKAAGTGLGLATVRELVMSFGAAITVQSDPGQGATFEVRFQKLADPAVAAGASRAQHAAPRVSGRLLLVEDDQLVRRSVARWLDLDGFEVVAVANGQEALSVLASASGITCVVSDIAMPCLDGEELAAVLAEKFPSLPLVLMSGNRTPAAHLLEGPARTFLPKPLDRSSLRGAIGRVTA
jgi:CheY-like chemotaxis protein/anti-sigma regulatory factor (Ser/Thr protein kinase)